MRRSLTALVLTAACAFPSAASLPADTTFFPYRPQLSVTLRPRAEWSTATGEGRFEVRNTDVTLSGRILPQVAYNVRADYCLAGKFQVLDAWMSVEASRRVAVQAGQFRMPFGVESFRAPHTYYFANRTFMGKQMCNVRAVGVKGTWSLGKAPVTIEGGVFNPTQIEDHARWCRTVAYSGRVQWRLPEGFTLTAGGMSLRPDGVRMNLVDGCVEWRSERWTAAAEYMYEHYTHNSHRASQAYVAFADYRMPVRWGWFNRLSFQGRFDGMTAHSSGWRNSEGQLVTDSPTRQRATIGTTLSYVHASGRFLDVRLNYEQYIASHGTLGHEGNKAVAELVLHF